MKLHDLRGKTVLSNLLQHFNYGTGQVLKTKQHV